MSANHNATSKPEKCDEDEERCRRQRSDGRRMSTVHVVANAGCGIGGLGDWDSSRLGIGLNEKGDWTRRDWGSDMSSLHSGGGQESE